MADILDNLRINLNQNLWGLVISFAALGLAEHYDLKTLFWFAAISAVISLVSVALTTLAYTVNYWRKKS